MNDRPEPIPESEVSFHKDEKGVKNMAVFLAQLTRESICFRVIEGDHVYTVELTGGF